jgi:hypothetical protein
LRNDDVPLYVGTNTGYKSVNVTRAEFRNAYYIPAWDDDEAQLFHVDPATVRIGPDGAPQIVLCHCCFRDHTAVSVDHVINGPEAKLAEMLEDENATKSKLKSLGLLSRAIRLHGAYMSRPVLNNDETFVLDKLAGILDKPGVASPNGPSGSVRESGQDPTAEDYYAGLERGGGTMGRMRPAQTPAVKSQHLVAAARSILRMSPN